MSSVTQKVSNYILGMSEQNDEIKQPGQVNNLQNGIPDVVRGCVKRPGSHLVSTLSPSTAAKTKWFNIYTSDTEQYIGQVGADGAVTVWRCSDGVSIPIDYADVAGSGAATYLDNSGEAAATSSDIQPFTINETTFFVNRRKTVEMETSAEKKSPSLVNEAFIALKQSTYGKQYALDIFDPDDNTTYTYTRATSIGADEDVDTSNIGGFADNGSCEGQGREVCPPSGSGTNAFTNTGTGIGSTSPPNASSGGKTNLRYEMDSRCNALAVGSAEEGTVTVYDDAYQPYAKLQFGGEGWDTGDTHTFRSTKGLETTVRITSHTTITSRANVAMVRPEPTSSTVDEHVSAGSILGGMKTTLDNITGGHGITTTIVGNGIHLYRATPFGVTTPERQLMDIVTAEANNIADLPTSCRHGYTVRIVNSGDDQDDYYLRFQVNGIDADITKRVTYARSGTTVTVTSTAHGLSTGDQVIADFTSGGATDGFYTITVSDANTFTFTDSASGTISAGANIVYQPFRTGEGVWEEVAAPGIDIEFKDSTMPIKLTRVVPSTQHTIATSAVNTSNEQITITGHELSTGDTVLYDNGGGTTLAGLSDDTVYYVIRASANAIALASNESNATAGVAVNLTGTGNNAQTLTHGYFAINGGSNTHYANGAFRFGYPDWSLRDAGDDVTNPKPSFIGYPIQKMMFFRNRIALLSQENVILSRVNDFYNFWAKTALTISNADPIDLQSSSTYPTKLFDGVETNSGLAIFSANQQFLLNTGAEALLTPETAKISFLSSYAFNKNTKPWSMGTSIGFLSDTGRNARFHEMTNIGPTSEPAVFEQSKVIGKTFPQNTTVAAESNENELVLFSVDSTIHTATNEVWGYKYHNQGDKRIQNAWFKWILPNKVVHHVVYDDVYYAVLNTGSTYTLEKFDIKLTDDTLVVGEIPDENRIHLDTKKTIATGDLTYNAGTDVTTFTLGAGYYSTNTLTTYTTTAGDKAGRSYDVPTNKITGTAPNETVELAGNWKYYDKTFAHTAVDIAAETITITDHKRETGDSLTYQESFRHTVTTSNVNTSTEIVTITGHGLSTADAVFYNNGGGTTLAGLTNDTVYYVIKISDNTIKLATNATNANAGTAINLTGTGNNSQTFSGTIGGLTDNTVYYVIKVDDDTIKLATNSSNATAGTAINLTRQGTGTHKFEIPTSLIVGYEYEFALELPKIYVTRVQGEKIRSETRGSLVIHRLNFLFGDVGVIDVTLKRKGRADYTKTYESLEWDNTLSNTPAIVDGHIHTIPVYDRNTNLSVHVKSNHPSPASLFSMNWEGDYNNKYYRSV